MKKKILSALVITAALFSTTPAFAAPRGAKAKCDSPAACTPRACCDSVKGKLPCPFEGLELTDAQKEKLKAIKRPACPDKRACADSLKTKDRPALTPEQKRAKRIEGRTGYLKSVKEILTPEQYVKFLENSFVNSPVKGKKDKKDKRGPGNCKDRRGGDHRGPRR